MAEVWIASDGTPSVNLGSELCQMGVVGSASGIICKMVSYSFQETKTLTTSLDFRMVIDTTLLGFSPSSSDVKYSGDGASWTNFGSTSTYNDFISRPLVNDTSSNNLYTISAYKIARPGNGNERPVPGQDKDLVWSPLQFTARSILNSITVGLEMTLSDIIG